MSEGFFFFFKGKQSLGLFGCPSKGMLTKTSINAGDMMAWRDWCGEKSSIFVLKGNVWDVSQCH